MHASSFSTTQTPADSLLLCSKTVCEAIKSQTATYQMIISEYLSNQVQEAVLYYNKVMGKGLRSDSQQCCDVLANLASRKKLALVTLHHDHTNKPDQTIFRAF